MRLLVHRCATIAHYHHVIAPVAGLPGGAFHHEVGRHPRQQQRPDAPVFQNRLQIRRHKRRYPALGHHRLPLPRGHRIVNRRPPGAFNQSVGPVQPLPQPGVGRTLRVARTELHRHIHHQRPRPAGRLQQPGGLAQHPVILHHLRETEILERPILVDNIILEVHHQQRRMSGVEFQSHNILHHPASIHRGKNSSQSALIIIRPSPRYRPPSRPNHPYARRKPIPRGAGML